MNDTSDSFKNRAICCPSQGGETATMDPELRQQGVGGHTVQSPSVLHSDAGLKAFLRWTTAWLQTELPSWMSSVAHDATVEAALAIRRQPERFPSIGHAYGYARTTAIRMAAKQRRWAWRETPNDSITEEASSASFEHALHAATSVRYALGRLPEHLKRTVTALKLEGMSVQEFAASEGIAESTVMNRMHQALKLLRDLLANEAP